MSFKLPYQKAENNFQDYLFALLIIVGAYIAGNIPAVITYSQVQADSNDIIQVIQQEKGNTVTFVLLLLPWIFVFFSLYPVSKFILKWPFTFLITNRKRIDFKRLFFAFGIWFLICLLTFFITKNELVLDNFQPEKFLPLFFVAVVILLIQCAAEELVFRSFLLKWLGERTSNGLLQIIITGTIFGYLHASNPEVDAIGNKALIYYIGTGVFLGLIAVIDDGLELTIGFHFANNLFAALIVTSDWQAFQTDAVFLDINPPMFTTADFFLAFGGQVLFFVICLKLFNWKNIKSKLL
jgi:membrane protease YdiL (CAAX protease family)